MPLTAKGQEILGALEKEYGPEKGKQVLYAGKNKGTFTGIDTAELDDSCLDHLFDSAVRGDEKIPPPKDPALRKEWEAAVKRREQEGRGKYVGDDCAMSDSNMAKLDAALSGARTLEARVDAGARMWLVRGFGKNGGAVEMRINAPDYFAAREKAIQKGVTDIRSIVLQEEAKNDDHRVLGGVGFTPPSGGVRPDADWVVGHHTLSGMKIPIVEVEPTTNVKFLSQQQLRDLGTKEAKAELERRAGGAKDWR